MKVRKRAPASANPRTVEPASTFTVIFKTEPGPFFGHRRFELKMPDGRIFRGETVKVATYPEMKGWIYITVNVGEKK